MARRLESLFERYRSRGDVSALAKIFDRTAPELLRIAMHLVREPAVAEDLLQETFLAALENAERYDPARRLVPWLTGILGNQARRHRRTEARHWSGPLRHDVSERSRPQPQTMFLPMRSIPGARERRSQACAYTGTEPRQRWCLYPLACILWVLREPPPAPLYGPAPSA